MGEDIISCEQSPASCSTLARRAIGTCRAKAVKPIWSDVSGVLCIAQLDLVDLRPPRIHHAPSRKLSYWDEMDTQLQDKNGPSIRQQYVSQSAEKWVAKISGYFPGSQLVALIILGIQQQQRVEELHSQLQQQAREIERMERMFSSPPQPTPNAQYTVHVPARMEL